MTNASTTHGLWAASAPPAPQTAALQQDIRADVAIVGAGFTGLSAALHLRGGGASVAVLEAHDVGFGGSGRNVGLVNAGMWVMPEALPAALGEVYGMRLLQTLGDAPAVVFDLIARYGMPCEAVHTGTLHCAAGAAGLAAIQERARQWQALGAPVRVLSAQETADKTGTTAYQGALLDLRAGTVQPLAYARGLAHAALAQGAQVFSHSPVVQVHDEGYTWCLRTASGHTVTAPWVIVATNAYSATHGPWPALAQELVHLPYFNMATEPLSPSLLAQILPEQQGAWDTKQVLTSFRRDQAGRLIFGSVGALRGRGQRIHRDWGQRALAHLFPALRGVRFEHAWYGSIGMTGNALPRFHQLARNTVSISGYNGRGIAPGTVFGKALAQLVLGNIATDDMPLPLTPLHTAPFKRTQELGYELGAQAVHWASARY
jgi:glycine/D-amino acid oxidase-like deaminating enzyme